jgi:hypothetical protein
MDGDANQAKVAFINDDDVFLVHLPSLSILRLFLVFNATHYSFFLNFKRFIRLKRLSSP